MHGNAISRSQRRQTYNPEIFFDITSIRENYKLVIANFANINAAIDCKRDNFDSIIADNLLSAYNHANKRLSASPENPILDWRDMLELNLIVHLGLDPVVRETYSGFIRHTEKKLAEQIPFLMKWYSRHERHGEDPYKIAAGIYVRILAAPQMFIDGNHRTGSLIANYYLLMNNRDPFVLTPHNAIEFFNLASDVKFKLTDIKSRFKRAIGWHDELARMRAFLEANARPFTTDAMPGRTP